MEIGQPEEKNAKDVGMMKTFFSKKKINPTQETDDSDGARGRSRRSKVEKNDNDVVFSKGKKKETEKEQYEEEITNNKDNLIASGEEIIRLGKQYFYGGILFLPLLWLVNILYLYPHIRASRISDKNLPSIRLLPKKKEKIRHSKGLKPILTSIQRRKAWKYLILSLIGCLIYSSLIITWFVIYSTRWNNWGIFGEKISINMKRG